MTNEERRIRAEDAKQLLRNKLLVEAFEGVGSYLEAQSIACDPDNKDKATRIIISKQLLAAIKREISRIVEDGEIAGIQIAELEKRGLLAKFRR